MTWRRPTLPCLETQYHGRWGFSRPSSGWDRVQAPRQNHQVVQSTPKTVVKFCLQSPDAGAQALGGDRGGGSGVRCVLTQRQSGDDFHAWCVWSQPRRPSCKDRRLKTDDCSRAYRAIRTGQLHALPHVHTRPINVMVYHGPQGDLVSRWVSRLDAFSGYPVRT